jgi:hypothetical protein
VAVWAFDTEHVKTKRQKQKSPGKKELKGEYFLLNFSADLRIGKPDGSLSVAWVAKSSSKSFVFMVLVFRKRIGYHL